MQFKDLKYLAAYIQPTLAFTGLTLGGYYLYLPIVHAFLIMPLMDSLGPQFHDAYDPETKKIRSSDRLFDFLLYLNIPLNWGLIFFMIYQLNTNSYTTFEMLLMGIGVGLVISASGINVGHELGHRSNKFDIFMALASLQTSFYKHFYIEHNLGHHKWIGTPDDPATARYNEPIYLFYYRAIRTAYSKAWSIERSLLKRKGIPFFSYQNRMLRFLIFDLLYLGLIVLLSANISVVLVVLLTAFVSGLSLELINYIEHYGLRRRKLSNGMYEPVNNQHSWDSNYYYGRIVLYELTRHSDHHHKANKKYQILEDRPQANQLPYGYAACYIVALIPPIWFRMMNHRVPKYDF